MNKHGKLIFKYGVMGGGKTLHLMATAHNFQEHSIPFLIIKSEIDTRDGRGVIHSRALGSRECLSISTDANIYEIISKYMDIRHCYIGCKAFKWILVDEVQFLSKEQVEQLSAIADNFGINIICYGLRTDFRGNLFEGSKRLFELADSFEEIKSSCDCNNKAIFNARINSDKKIILDGEQIDIGGDEKYTAMCRVCYFKSIKHPLYLENDNNLD